LAREARLIGIALSGVWIVLAGAYGVMHAAAGAHREAMLCYRVQAEVNAAPQYAAADAVLHGPLCGWESAVSTASALDHPSKLAWGAGIAVVPPALVWTFVLWRRRKEYGAVACR
jgi:hypothetical protein